MKSRFRTKSTRNQYWDYSSPASYFVTMVTKDRRQYFGEIVNGKMILSEMGKIAVKEWQISPSMRPDMNLHLGEFVVMPDNFHAIITIGQNKYNSNGNNGILQSNGSHSKTTSTINNWPGVNGYDHPNRNGKFGPQSKNLGSIIRGFKISVTKNSRIIDKKFAWQANYHGHIITERESIQRIENYIINNPKNWKY